MAVSVGVVNSSSPKLTRKTAPESTLPLALPSSPEAPIARRLPSPSKATERPNSSPDSSDAIFREDEPVKLRPIVPTCEPLVKSVLLNRTR